MKKRIKICRFNEAGLLPSFEGATQVSTNLSKELSLIGVDVVIFQVHRGWSEDFDLLKKQPFKTYLLNEELFYNDFFEVVKLIRYEEIDIVVFHDCERLYSLAGFIKREIPNIKIFFEAHDIIPDFLTSLNREKHEILESQKILKEVISYCDFIMCLTKADFNSLINYGANPNRMAVISAGTNISNIEYMGTNSLTKNNILFLGNMYHEPNRIALDIIISTIMPEVLKKISNSRLLLVGDAPEIIKKRVEDIKYISYYGKVLDLNQVFSETSIAICPVTTGSGLRIKVLDYLAAGLPIITTSLGLPEVDLKNALIIEDNINSFSKHIINILKNKVDVENFSINARNKAKDLSWENIAQQTKKMYELVLSQAPKKNNIELKHTFRISEPYYLQDFKKLGRFKGETPQLNKFKYAIIHEGEIKIF